MGNLLVSLINSAGALRTFQRTIDTVQTNVANSSTPGFAKQRQTLVALSFDPARGLPGGVEAGPVMSSRDEYAEQVVRRQTEWRGYSGQRAASLSRMEPMLDIAADSGIGGALNKFFESLSGLTVSPNDTASRQVAIDRAANVARTFNRIAADLGSYQNDLDGEAKDKVKSVMAIGESLRQLNKELRSSASARDDAGLDAQVHTLLERLAGFADFTALKQEDGTFSVYLGGQTLFVLGDSLYPVSYDGTGQEAVLRDYQGNAMGWLERGDLAGLMSVRNQELGNARADLNALAAGFADAVNGTLAGGLDQSGAAPVMGLFRYDTAADAALTLATTNLQPAELALAAPGAPGGNGNATALAALSSAKLFGGYTFSEGYGLLAGTVGRALATERQTLGVREQMVAQAKTLRDQVSRVSLDEEAAQLLAYQRAYQAAAQMVTTLNEMTQVVFSMMR